MQTLDNESSGVLLVEREIRMKALLETEIKRTQGLLNRDAATQNKHERINLRLKSSANLSISESSICPPACSIY